jgi:hypothetical protein
MTDIKKRGGFRLGSGRKKSEPTTVIRVPVGALPAVKQLIESYKSTPEPPKAPKSTPEPNSSLKPTLKDLEDSTKNPYYDWKVKPMSSEKRAKAKLKRKKNKKA